MRGNKMGPENKGPKTGRGLGFCSGNNQPGCLSEDAPLKMGRGRRAEFGRGSGRGNRGLGYGAGHGFGRRNSLTESEDLRARVEKLEKALEELKK